MTVQPERHHPWIDGVLYAVIVLLAIGAIWYRYVSVDPTSPAAEVCRLQLAGPSDAHDTLMIMRESVTCQRMVNDVIDHDRAERARQNVPPTLGPLP
jgi:hypothetical protein